MAGKKKRSSLKKGPNRNALCPCGSGRAFKNCCAEKRSSSPERPESLPNQFRRLALALGVLVVVAGGIALAVLRPWEEGVAERQPFEYDAQTNRYWHEGHGHWHDGPPPVAPAPEPASAAAPRPWEYNAVRDEHWHAAHGHWHPGTPPPPEQR